MATAQATPPAPSAGAPKASRSQLGVIFLTIFLDLLGFSLIFPLFPKMLQYYLPTADQVGMLADTVRWLKSMGGSSSLAVDVLFGGLLGSLYSVLQFFASPFWGKLSDRVGRRTVLLGTVAGTALSYVLWIFAGQFWMLVLARGLGGIMAGNVTVCSAAIADVTTPEKRSRGMALVGMAFGLGFILGPAIGGMLSVVDLSAKFPALAAYGLNPFSMCALVSFVFCIGNYFWVLVRFPETLPAEKRAAAAAGSDGLSAGVSQFKNVFQSDLPAIRRTNLVSLFYTIAFAGMEFTLTFLAAERFNYSARDTGWMFVFMGFILLLTIGSGRRYVSKIGEKKTTMFGMVCGMVGFLILAFATNLTVFYIGMAVFAVSSGIASVCLPALVSLYSAATTQGQHSGSARAAQALGRAIGPIFSALIYFQAGARVSYSVGAVALLIPLWLTKKLPAPKKE